MEELQAKLKLLSDSYAAQLPERLKLLEQVWENLPKNSWDEAGFETLHRMVHSLTGSGRTFGFAGLSDVARNLEDYLRQLVQVKTPLSEEQREHIQVLVSELHSAAIR
ncbi:MAG: Hpt domain-containing protein [Sterolibacterium sp.]|nr:Hpt domain-containing protein [Sterolibacterium sp.]